MRKSKCPGRRAPPSPTLLGHYPASGPLDTPISAPYPYQIADALSGVRKRSLRRRGGRMAVGEREGPSREQLVHRY